MSCAGPASPSITRETIAALSAATPPSSDDRLALRKPKSPGWTWNVRTVPSCPSETFV
jgi:hypothetical protein